MTELYASFIDWVWAALFLTCACNMPELSAYSAAMQPKSADLVLGSCMLLEAEKQLYD
jgi:hypothetical protein